MNLKMNTKCIPLPPLFLLVQVIAILLNLKTQITVHGLVVDCGLGFL